ncbi:MAG: PD40 domain-containing protein [Anaerolineae bacterium]|nr:PD40 domain-containing protein [Anaerolineae bacterium]
MKRFFISYAKKDTRDLALKLAEAFDKPPLASWMDRELTPADKVSWEARIEQNIDNCDYFIVLISKDVNRASDGESGESFVRKEIRRGLSKKKTILVVMCDENILPPTSINHLQQISFVGRKPSGEDIDWLVEQICKEVDINPPEPYFGRIMEKRAIEKRAEELKRQQEEDERELKRRQTFKSDRERQRAINQQLDIVLPDRNRGRKLMLVGVSIIVILCAVSAAGVFGISKLRTRLGLIRCTEIADAKNLFGGGRIAFDSTWESADGNTADIYVMDADGSNQQRLTKEAGSNTFPIWSPDGKQIAFVSERDGNSEIYVMNSDGTTQRNLTMNKADDYTPSWSADGQSIVFASTRGGSNLNLYIVPTIGGTAKKLLDNSFVLAGNPAWSPNGSAIVFAAMKKGFVHTELFTVDPTGSNVKQVTNLSTQDFLFPQWSPNGLFVASQFRSANEKDLPEPKVIVVRLDNNQQQVVYSGIFPTWAPNEEYLAFGSFDWFNSRLLAVSVNGDFACVLSDRKGDFHPNWTRA